MVHAFPSLQSVGHRRVGSQVSPRSITPSPQLPEQSSSRLESQPVGQHPSRLTQVVMPMNSQVALQLALEPTSLSAVQAVPSSHAAGQLDGGSQVSPGSMLPLPQVAPHAGPPSRPQGWCVASGASGCAASGFPSLPRSKSVTQLQAPKLTAKRQSRRRGGAFMGGASNYDILADPSN